MSGRFRLFFSGLSLFMLLVLFFTVFGERGLLHLQRLRQENRTLEEHIFILMHKNRELRSHIMRLRTDDDFLEKVAREELGLAKKGEIIYRFRRRGELSEASVSELSFSSVNERSEWSPQSGQRSERSLRSKQLSEASVNERKRVELAESKQLSEASVNERKRVELAESKQEEGKSIPRSPLATR